MNLVGKFGFSGEVKVIRVSGKGFYENVTTGIFAKGMPEGIKLRHRLYSMWLELLLRIRLFFVGAWRGLHGGGVAMVGRLHITRIRCGCGEDHASRARHKALGLPCPAGIFDHLGLRSTRLVTDAFATYLRNDWNDGASDVNLFNFHGCGTGSANEAVGDTTLGAECTTALNPDSTRATGTKTVPTANTFRTVGTLTFDQDAAVTEHGIFTQAATGGGTLMDRSKFAAVNVVGAQGDSIQFTYTGTINSGG